MYLATINGWPELGFLVAWDIKCKDRKQPFPSQCELVLATHNGRDTYNNQVLLDRGFELSPQHYRNPNSEAERCSFFAGWRENVKIDDLISEERPFKSLPRAEYQYMPYFCGIRIGPKEFYTHYKVSMEHCCGNIHILNPVNQEEDLNFFLKIGFEPVVHFKSGRVLLARFFPEYLVKE